MPSTPESEETRPVSEEEIEAAAKAICEGRSDDWTIPDQRMNAEDDARAALEAAAALHQPREGAEPNERTPGASNWWGAYRKVNAQLSTTEAALAESRGTLEELKDAAKEYRTMVAGWFDFADTDAYDELNAAIVHADRALEAPHEST